MPNRSTIFKLHRINHTFLFVSELLSNRKKLGISESPDTYRGRFYYNELVSNLLFNPDRKTAEDECREKLKSVAIVRVEMSLADVLVFEKSLTMGISAITTTGGLLSLYVGFSFLSLAELVFWVLRSLIFAALQAMRS